MEEIRTSTNKGMAVGNDRFKEEIETLTGRRLKAKKERAACRVAEFNFTLTIFSLQGTCTPLDHARAGRTQKIHLTPLRSAGDL